MIEAIEMVGKTLKSEFDLLMTSNDVLYLILLFVLNFGLLLFIAYWYLFRESN